MVELEVQLLNEITLQVQIEAPIRAPPGQDIDIGLSTKPYSYVGLMVVDQNAAGRGKPSLKLAHYFV